MLQPFQADFFLLLEKTGHTHAAAGAAWSQCNALHGIVQSLHSCTTGQAARGSFTVQMRCKQVRAQLFSVKIDLSQARFVCLLRVPQRHTKRTMQCELCPARSPTQLGETVRTLVSESSPEGTRVTSGATLRGARGKGGGRFYLNVTGAQRASLASCMGLALTQTG